MPRGSGVWKRLAGHPSFSIAPWRRTPSHEKCPRDFSRGQTASHARGAEGGRLEGNLDAGRQRAEFRTDVRPQGNGRAVELVYGAVQVVDHEPHVSVHVPIQPGGDDVLRSAGDAVGYRGRDAGREEGVEIDIAVANGDFPGAPSALRQGKRIVGDDAEIRAGGGIVLPAFPRDGPACLRVPPAEMYRWQAGQ